MRRSADMRQTIVSVDEMQRAERLAAPNDEAVYELMERAGLAVAQAAGEFFPAAHEILLLVGPGNNGGDGYVAARHLRQSGCRVRVLALDGAAPKATSARHAFDLWNGPVGRIAAEADLAADLVIDAVFGVGLTRALPAALEAVFDRLREKGAPVLAVDIPSGVMGDSGAALGRVLPADHTVTFECWKPAHLLLPGRTFCGHVSLVPIGIGGEIVESLPPRGWKNTPGLWLDAFPRPEAATHKYKRGHALVLSGPKWRTGAARLAARAALRSGAGLVTLCGEAEALAVHATQVSSIQLAPAADAHEFDRLLAAEPRYNAVVVGPAAGVGEGTRAVARSARRYGRALVLDADGLTSFAGHVPELRDAIAESSVPAVLTPHDAEFARLFAGLGDILEPASKLQRARQAAAVTGAVIVLKGADSVVAAPDGRASIADNAPPWLATAGAGDVLCGIIAGLLAQGMPGFEAASAAVWMHGEAAAAFGPGLIADDLPELLPQILRKLL